MRIDIQGSSEGFKPVAIGIDSRLEERPDIEFPSIRRGAEADCFRTRFRRQGQHATHPAISEWRVDGDARSSQERCAGRALRLEHGGGGGGIPGRVSRFLKCGGKHSQPGGRFRLGHEEEIHLTARARGKGHGAES